MSRKSIRKLEKIFSQENVRGIKKDPDTGLYRIVTQSVVREHNSGEIKAEKSVLSEDLYKICKQDDADVTFSYQDIDESITTIYLKKT
tara:strand:+ start:175 stop:438 length:264 start_codon:yes stop_codon:yes gene_type:complete